MRAVRFHDFGPPAVLRLEEVPTPSAVAGELIVKVGAAAVNHLDLDVRSGTLRWSVRLPHIPGTEFAGEVAATAAPCDFAVGDRVVAYEGTCGSCAFCLSGRENLCYAATHIGLTLAGAYAEYVVAPARCFVRLPDAVPFETAAVAQLSFGTAWHMLMTRGHLQRGETVLINAAASAVGTAAIQIAQLAGAHIIASAGSATKLHSLRALGADHVVNYTTEDLVAQVMAITEGRGADLVFEHVGGQLFAQVMRLLARGGRIVTCGAHAGEVVALDLIPFFRREFSLIGCRRCTTAELAHVLVLLAQGVLRPSSIEFCLSHKLKRRTNPRGTPKRRENFARALSSVFSRCRGKRRPARELLFMTVTLESRVTLPSFSERLLELFFEYPADRITESARKAVLLCIEDTLGVSLAASALRVGTAGVTVALEDGGAGEAAIWGTSSGARAVDACLANGMLAHALDYDDTHPAAIMHASAANIPVALAIGEATGACASDILSAAILGYEISARLGRLGPGPFQDHGFQSTAVLGTFAATFIAARLMKVGPRVAAQAMGVAGSMASGLMAYLADATDVKQMHPGWSAHSGVKAVQLARAGLTGPATVFEGKFGVFRSFAKLDIDPESVLSFSGERFEVEEMAPKPYPACLCAHPIVQAVLELRARGVLSPERTDAVENIHCEVPEWYVNLIFDPLEQKAAARNAYEGRFSGPYCIARSILDGTLEVQSFSREKLADERIAQIARKVTYQVRTFREFPETFPALVRVRLRDGSTHEAFVPNNLGSVKNPLGAEGIGKKYRANADFALGARSAIRLQSAIRGLETSTSIDEFWRVLRSAVVRPGCGAR